ncbi:MAG TPA: sigma-70 family RNA polymerase sigma factor [Planctomycetaceae bacterium]|jgi:RNA polymerase sigma-70 factor (ECF subfamily)
MILTTNREPDTDELVRRARRGDSSAANLLIDRHRHRLRRMVAIRMDRRLVRRLDPSDVVQEALVEALRLLPEYLRDRPMPFYPWLRQIAWNRLVDLHRRHIISKRRSLDREVQLDVPLDEQSAYHLADVLLAREPAPGARLLREELLYRVRKAVDRLPSEFREVLILRQIEQLSVEEIAAVLSIPQGTVKSRHFRALSQLRELLDEDT